MTALVVTGGDVLVSGRLHHDASVVVEGGRIVDLVPGRTDGPAGAIRVEARGALVAPGFIDVHVHGVEGIDAFSGPDAIPSIARLLPRYGVTAFCPTTVACGPGGLAAVLTSAAVARGASDPRAARVLPAHLESNFINPEFNGAQPRACLRVPHGVPVDGDTYHADDILRVIDTYRAGVGIVTLAPELRGGIELVHRFSAAGIRVSIGHSGASYEQALAAIDAGVRHATHLFNRMTPMTHRAPGIPGAVFDRAEVAAEIISDGAHVHPSLVRVAVRAKGVEGVMAITDGTAGAGLPVGTRARLGPAEIVVGERVATLNDGTLAGSVLTMDRAFRVLVREVGLAPHEAARLCATTPAARLGLADLGEIAAGRLADLVVLDASSFQVRQTIIAGRPVLEP